MEDVAVSLKKLIERAHRVGVSRKFATDHKLTLRLHYLDTDKPFETVEAIGRNEVALLRQVGVVENDVGKRRGLTFHGLIVGKEDEHARLGEQISGLKTAFENIKEGNFVAGAVSTYSRKDLERVGPTVYEKLVERIPALGNEASRAHIVTLHFSAPSDAKALNSIRKTLRKWQGGTKLKRGPYIGRHSVF